MGARADRLDSTQVTCLLSPLLTPSLTSKSRIAAEVSVCFTQRHTLLSLPQELFTLTIPITLRPPETAGVFFFFSSFLFPFLLQNRSFVLPTRYLCSSTEQREKSCNERPGIEGERSGGVKWMKSPGCSAAGDAFIHSFPLPFLISWSSLHVGAGGQCLLGDGLKEIWI